MMCQDCPHFNPHQGRAGWCTEFDSPASPTHQLTSQCPVDSDYPYSHADILLDLNNVLDRLEVNLSILLGENQTEYQKAREAIANLQQTRDQLGSVRW